MTETERKLLADIQRIYEVWCRIGPSLTDEQFRGLNIPINTAYHDLKPLKEEIRIGIVLAVDKAKINYWNMWGGKTMKMITNFWTDKKQANAPQNKG